MHNTTIIFSLFLDNLEYLQNFRLTLDFYREKPFQLIVVEQESKNSAIEFLKQNNFQGKYISFRGQSNRIYERTRSINMGLLECQTETAFVCDVDALVDKSCLEKAVEHLERDQTLIYPYDRVQEIHRDRWNSDYFRLPMTVEESSWMQNYSLKEILDMFIRPLEYTNFDDSRTYNNLGLIYGVNVNNYAKIGAENPFFVDWGFEDLERSERTMKLTGKECQRIPGTCVHLHHERRHRHSNYKLNNFFEWRKVCEMNDEELSFYVNSWPKNQRDLN